MKAIFWFCLLSLVLMACSGPLIQDDSPKYSLRFSNPVTLAGQQYHVAWLDEPETRAQGLMYIEKLAADQGALFVYPEKQSTVNFWMKDVQIPLDMLFFDHQRKLLRVLADVQPCSSVCPIYTVPDVKYVLELKAGEAVKLGLEFGDVIDLHSAQ